MSRAFVLQNSPNFKIDNPWNIHKYLFFYFYFAGKLLCLAFKGKYEGGYSCYSDFFFFFKKGDFWNSQWNSLVFQHAMCMENVGNRAKTHLSKYVSKMWNKRRITTVVTHMFFYSPKEPYQKIFRAYLRLFVKSRRFVFLHLLQVR